MADTPAWYETGFDTEMPIGSDRIPRQFDRYWMKPGTETGVIFLTSEPFIYWEHNVKMNGSWQFWFTCLKSMKMRCPLCEYADRNKGQFAVYKAAAFTVIDTSEYKGKDGKVYKNQKKLYVAKSNTWEKLKRKHLQRVADGNSLRGALLTVFRTSKDKSPAVGEEFDFVKMMDLGAFDSTEFNYMEKLKPNPEMVKRVALAIGSGGGEVEEFGKSSGSSGGETDVAY